MNTEQGTGLNREWLVYKNKKIRTKGGNLFILQWSTVKKMRGKLREGIKIVTKEDN